MNNLFSGAEVVSAYTRAQALRDGGLIDVTETAREARVPCPCGADGGRVGRLRGVGRQE